MHELTPRGYIHDSLSLFIQYAPPCPFFFFSSASLGRGLYGFSDFKLSTCASLRRHHATSYETRRKITAHVVTLARPFLNCKDSRWGQTPERWLCLVIAQPDCTVGNSPAQLNHVGHWSERCIAARAARASCTSRAGCRPPKQWLPGLLTSKDKQGASDRAGLRLLVPGRPSEPVQASQI